MTAKEVKGFYRLIASTYGVKEPNEEEGKSWVEVLAFFKVSDLDAAWRRWQNDTEIEDFTKRPRGARMPKPAELKSSIEQFRMRQNAARNHYIPCRRNGCMDGFVFVVENEKTTARVKRCDCWHEHMRDMRAMA